MASTPTYSMPQGCNTALNLRVLTSWMSWYRNGAATKTERERLQAEGRYAEGAPEANLPRYTENDV